MPRSLRVLGWHSLRVNIDAYVCKMKEGKMEANPGWVGQRTDGEMSSKQADCISVLTRESSIPTQSPRYKGLKIWDGYLIWHNISKTGTKNVEL